MGRPFILYDDDDTTCCSSDDSPSTSSLRGNDPWTEAACKCLAENGYDVAHVELKTILAYLLTQRKTAYMPICAPAPANGLGLISSKIGGLPYLMPSETWPTDGGTGLCHLWQQLVSDLPLSVRDALGFSRGLLQVFLSESLEGTEGKWFLVRVLTEDQLIPRSPSEIVVGPDVDVLPEQAVTGFRVRDDWPQLDDLLDYLPEGMGWALMEDIVCLLMEHDLYETVSGDKLLGWPNWCQGPEWGHTDGGEQFLQLVQIEGNVVPFVVGGSGTLVLQRHPQEKSVWDVSWGWVCC